MGAPRLTLLEKALPDLTVILGIDEYTACVVDPAAEECLVLGAGQVTIRHDGHEHVFPAGTSFGLEQLRASTLRDARQAAKSIALPQEEAVSSATKYLTQLLGYKDPALADKNASNLTDVVGYVCELATAIERAQNVRIPDNLIDAGRQKMRVLLQVLSTRLSAEGDQGPIGPLMDVIIATRQKLRVAKQYALADKIRSELAKIN